MSLHMLRNAGKKFEPWQGKAGALCAAEIIMPRALPVTY
jgi:hypothetical protein